MKEVSCGMPVACVLFSLSFGLLMNFFVPPFQCPDEPQHFSAVMVYALGPEKEPEIMREIIRIMDRNNWWRFVGMGKPGVLPRDFSRAGFLAFMNIKSGIQGISLYHFLLGRLLRCLKTDQIITSYYICRFFSIFFLSIALAFIGMTFQRVAAAGRLGLAYAPLFALFLPQFVLMTVSVNPDVFSILLGAVFFYAAFSILAGGTGIHRFILLVFAAFAAYFTDRSVYSLILLLGLFPLFLFRRNRLGFSLLKFAAVIVALVAVAALVEWKYPGQIEMNFLYLVRYLQGWPERLAWVLSSHMLGPFIQLLLDSFYLKFGWMAFSPAPTIQWVWRAALLLSGVGLGYYLIRRAISSKSNEKPLISSMPNFRQILFSFLALGLQLAGLLIAFGRNHVLGQGRYFFPLMTAVALLFVAGTFYFFEFIHKRVGHVAIGVFVLVEFFFLNYIIWNDVVPVFHLTIKSPHPGL